MAPRELRRILGVKDRATLWRYLTGMRIPQPKVMQQIIELTNGQVGLRDFLDPASPKCATVITMPDGRVRLILPWSQDPTRHEVIVPGEDFEPRITPPIKRALKALGGRGWFTPTGKVLLDGRVTDLKRLVKAANDNLKADGKDPIPYPGLEPKE